MHQQRCARDEKAREREVELERVGRCRAGGIRGDEARRAVDLEDEGVAREREAPGEVADRAVAATLQEAPDAAMAMPTPTVGAIASPTLSSGIP